ncbi:uncharacterized protein LOC106637583 [Copidosoma floridanum]|uniref:uncharacterized protein LOC106637583 n=1 Tax=Copidosoma floridanum TaxID=29053 RepID=UPI0006C9633B|nr:uncharacterized protein LOC106637583 [Copidosoma floridanum]
MDESWYVTPPACFTRPGPVHVETSPLENLLIEHPSMSVYAGASLSGSTTASASLISSSDAALVDLDEDGNAAVAASPTREVPDRNKPRPFPKRLPAKSSPGAAQSNDRRAKRCPPRATSSSMMSWTTVDATSLEVTATPTTTTRQKRQKPAELRHRNKNTKLRIPGKLEEMQISEEPVVATNESKAMTSELTPVEPCKKLEVPRQKVLDDQHRNILRWWHMRPQTIKPALAPLVPPAPCCAGQCVVLKGQAGGSRGGGKSGQQRRQNLENQENRQPARPRLQQRQQQQQQQPNSSVAERTRRTSMRDMRNTSAEEDACVSQIHSAQQVLQKRSTQTAKRNRLDRANKVREVASGKSRRPRRQDRLRLNNSNANNNRKC